MSQDLYKKYGAERVIDTPITEMGFAGLGVGAAQKGLRPIIEFMTFNFSMQAIDQIVNSAAKSYYMSGGKIHVPIVFRGPNGVAASVAAQHSQCFAAWYSSVPGLKVLAPYSSEDAKCMLKAAIRDDNPVVFLEHKLLYAKKEQIPDGEYLIPLGKADVKRPGRDLTILTWSRQVYFSLEAAETLAAQGIDAEVVDLRTLVPLDWEAIRASVQKTGNVMVVEEGVRRGGVGAELAAEIQEELFDDLDAPVARVAGANIVPPFSPPLEDVMFPHPADIVAAAHKLLAK